MLVTRLSVQGHILERDEVERVFRSGCVASTALYDYTVSPRQAEKLGQEDDARLALCVPAVRNNTNATRAEAEAYQIFSIQRVYDQDRKRNYANVAVELFVFDKDARVPISLDLAQGCLRAIERRLTSLASASRNFDIGMALTRVTPPVRHYACLIDPGYNETPRRAAFAAATAVAQVKREHTP